MPNAEYYAKNKERLLEYDRQWRKDNRQKRLDSLRKWYQNNREQQAQYRKEYYRKHAEEQKRYAREWAKANRERCARNARLRRISNPEKTRIADQKQIPRTQKWRKDNPVMVRIQNHRRRERVRSTYDKSAINVLSQLISSTARLKCAICGKNMPKSDRTIDHVIPLSKGGTGDIWNLSVVHHVCNIRKNAKMPDELNFADEAVRNCNTNPRTGRMRGVPRIDIQSAAINETKGNQ